MEKLHVAPNPPAKGAPFVVPKIVPYLTEKIRINRIPIIQRFLTKVVYTPPGAHTGQMLDILGEHYGHRLNGQNMIDQICENRPCRHTVEFSGFRRLSDDQTVLLFHGPKADDAIRHGTGENNTNGIWALIFTQEPEKIVNRGPGVTSLSGPAHS